MSGTTRTLPQASRPWFQRVFAALTALPLIPAIGLNLPLSTVLAVLVLPLRAVRRVPRVAWLIAASSVLGSLAFLISAAANDVPLSTAGVGNFAVVAIFTLALTRTVPGLPELARFLGIASVGAVAYLAITGSGDTRGSDFESFWKFNIAVPATIAVLWVVCAVGKRWLSLFTLIGLGAISIFLNNRSVGLICFVAAAVVFAIGNARGKLPVGRLLLGGIAATLAAIAIIAAMSQGWLGQAVQERTLRQSASEGGILLGGRTEVPLSIAAIIEHPILGWGNADAIGQPTINVGVSIARSLGITDPRTYYGYWVLPDGSVSLHSILFGSWAEGGIAAAIMPIVAICALVYGALMARGQWAPFVVFLTLMTTWDILFSPWSGNRSIVVAGAVVSAILVSEQRRFPGGPHPRAVRTRQRFRTAAPGNYGFHPGV